MLLWHSSKPSAALSRSLTNPQPVPLAVPDGAGAPPSAPPASCLWRENGRGGRGSAAEQPPIGRRGGRAVHVVRGVARTAVGPGRDSGSDRDGSGSGGGGGRGRGAAAPADPR